MRWLRPQPQSPRIPPRPRPSTHRGSCDLPSEELLVSGSLENTSPSSSNDNGGILQEAIPRQHNPPRYWIDQLSMGDATLPDPDDLIQAIYAEEQLGWRRRGSPDPAAPGDHLDTANHPPGDPLPNYMALPEPETLSSDQHAVEPRRNMEGETIPVETYHDTPDAPSRFTLPPGWEEGAVASDEPGPSALGDGPSSTKPSINSPAPPPKKKARQFPLAIPKPSFNFIPKKSAGSPKQPTRSNSILPKLRGKTKSDEPSNPATEKRLRFSTEVQSSKPPTKSRRPFGRKKKDGSKKGSLASGEISPVTTTEPESSFVLPPFAEPTDIPAEPADAPGSVPKPKPHKPRNPLKNKKRIPLTRLSPTAVSPIPDQPYEHIPSPEEPDPHKKLRLNQYQKVKGGTQRFIRRWRKFTLRKTVLQIMLGRQLAGPVAANLKVLAGRKTVLEGGPGTGLWGIADGGLGERSLSGRAVGG
ncbi:hypothetical protein V490_04214 [Pseudogymnoascus sp. VKM F-3557]|nr:hypothetical protein V490_04214 [Pseudogymnoascus sp. VKM F-3557]